MESRLATYGYALYEPGVQRTEVIYDIALATIWNVVRTLCGSKWLPREVLFARWCPADLRPCRNFMRAPLRFDSGQSAVVFDRAWLDVPLPTADPQRLAQLEAEALQIESRATENLVGLVRRVIRRQLLSGRSSMHSVAEEHAVHRRTLDRRLQSHGVGFQTLSDEVGYEVSRQLLATTTMPIIAIAQSLRYADASAFSHAFRRWSGTTPTEWRVSAPSSASQQFGT